MAIYNSIWTPYSVAFGGSESFALWVSERVIDIAFFLDLLLAFRTTYVGNETGDEIIDSC